MEQMSLKVTCPHCKREFDFDFGEKGHRKCPNCKQGIPDEKILPHPSSIDKLQIPEEKNKWKKFVELELSKYQDKNKDRNIPGEAEQNQIADQKESKEIFETIPVVEELEAPFVPDDYYTLPWGTDHPGHIVYLVDMSGSMANDGKFETIKEVIQEVSDLVVSMCKKSTKIQQNGRLVPKTIVKDRVSVTIIAYNSSIIKLFEGNASELNIKLKEAIGLKRDDNPFPLLNTFSDNIKPSSMTYTEDAFKAALLDIKQWISQQENSGKQIPAPVIIHITDGHPEEKGIEESESISKALRIAEDIQNVEVPDGKALLFNIHFDGKKTTEPLRFPNQPPSDARRRFLFYASSPLSAEFCKRARAIGLDVGDGCRFMVSNETEKKLLVRLIKFGSVVSSTGNSNLDLPKID